MYQIQFTEHCCSGVNILSHLLPVLELGESSMSELSVGLCETVMTQTLINFLSNVNVF